MQKTAKFLIPFIALLCLTPWLSSSLALITGVLVALIFGNPYQAQTKKYTKQLLALAVVGLGAGMDLRVVGKVGFQGLGYTAIGIFSTLALGTLLGRYLKIGKDASLLITCGTAICGGSAIAAIAPTIQAKDHETSVALGTVFLLNAVGLILFPMIGHHFELSQVQFGLWSALAIHDTSSVVGATLQYGQEALQVGTTVKLARALWIVPLTLAIGYWRKKSSTSELQTGPTPPPARPWFILGFLITAALVTWIPELSSAGHVVESFAKRAMVLTLFLIGTNLSRETLKSVGVRPLIQGVLLWICVASATLSAILLGWIH